MENTFDHLPGFLQKHPLIGMICGIAGSAIHWMGFVGPILSFIGLVLGVGIAAITLHIKIMEWRLKCKELNEKKHENTTK